MSSTSTFALGLGGGLALWHLTKLSPAVATSPTKPATARNRHVHLDASGLDVDGARVDLHEAVRRCESAEHVAVSVDPAAPAAAYATLVTTLRANNVRLFRNAAGHGPTDLKTTFALITYPEGRKAGPTTRHFRADAPISWTEARDRLAAAGMLDLRLAGRTYEPGGWMLSIAARDFRAHRAEPLPLLRNTHTSSTFTLVVHPKGLGGPKRIRWYRAETPIAWLDARDRLADARLLDPRVRAPGEAGYWQLVTDPRAFQEARAEALPVARTRDADRSKRFGLSGRTILRDGEPILLVERVDLGDARYAISPHHADLLAQRIVRLLNQHGGK